MPDPQPRAVGDRAVYPIGIGCLPMSIREDRDDARSVRAIHAALDAGVRLLDTADAYALDEAEFGHNERLIARALREWGGGDEVLVATKGGHTRRGREWLLDGRPKYLRQACEGSLRRLGVECVDLYQFHRPDPKVPYAESVGALRDLRDEGKVREVGISNADVEQIELTRTIVPLAAVQNELSLQFPHPLANGELELCDREGIAFLPWSPFGGISRAGELEDGNPLVVHIAARHDVSPYRVMLAWLLSLSEVVLPIPGASRPESAVDSAQAPRLDLSDEELHSIGALFAA